MPCGWAKAVVAKAKTMNTTIKKTSAFFIAILTSLYKYNLSTLTPTAQFKNDRLLRCFASCLVFP